MSEPWTDARHAEAKARCEAAEPGPWKWREQEFNDAIAPMGRNGKRRAKPGRKIRDTLVYCLKGRPSYDPPHDRWDYRTVMELSWNQVKGSALINVGPGQNDADFIEHARTDLPDALAEIERLRAELEALENYDEPPPMP